MGSTRLPGKVLAELAGKPMLLHVVERARAIGGIDDVIVATTTNALDDQLVALMRRAGVDVFRGSETDVLDRYYQAAAAYRAKAVMRITADCPLLDPGTSEKVLRYFQGHPLDYASNVLERRTFPDGLDTEVFTFSALQRAWHEAALSSEREHVTPYIWKHPERFLLGGIGGETDLSHHRWTVDEPCDLEFIRALWQRLPNRGVPALDQVLGVLQRHPELLRINAGLESNVGYTRSVLEDRVV